MDVFEVRDRLIGDYREYTQSFVEPRDPGLRQHVEERIASGYQWPDPWLSLNPAFAPGGSISELVAEGLLHQHCEQIFRISDGRRSTKPLQLHRHQREAIEVARTDRSYVLTTGTGSGKSLAYLIPIVDRILRARAAGAYRQGIKAIVIYPMNALANSQLGELEKFLGSSGTGGPVSFRRYTGQESGADRAEIIADPPDILLTNYVMAELILTRPNEADLVAAAHGLWFLVLDELHTYRGRQGADVALLVRRLREACSSPNVQCVGTSATLTTEGGPDRQRAVAAEVASRIFGLAVAAEDVIGETLDRVTTPAPQFAKDLRAAIGVPPPDSYEEIVRHPLAAWVEETLGFADGPANGPRLRRRRPLTLPGAGGKLSETTGAGRDECIAAIKEVLEAGAAIRNPSTGRPVFAFRLHQFLSKGDNVYVTAEPPGRRHLTSKYQVEAPTDSTDQPDGGRRRLYPLAFCRECGQEYLIVCRQADAEGAFFTARQDNDASGGDDINGYLYISHDRPWPRSRAELLEEAWLPYTWLTTGPDGGPVVTADKEKYLPEPLHVTSEGRVTDPGAGTPAAYLTSPFRFCLRCLVSYEQARGSDFAKLAKLSVEGRSSATSVVSASIVAALRRAEDNAGSGKLLAFVDNRQDASLQSGHFNDYVQVAQLRGALYRALLDAPGGLTHDVIPQRVTDALGLQLADFAQAPDAAPGLRDAAWRALREVTGFRLYLDLERGWRVTMPNLEQTGLLRIVYPVLAETAADQARWDDCHGALRDDDPAHRGEVAAALLDELRRNLAIEVSYLTLEGFDPVKRQSQQHLTEPWSLPERELPPVAGAAFPGPGISSP